MQFTIIISHPCFNQPNNKNIRPGLLLIKKIKRKDNDILNIAV